MPEIYRLKGQVKHYDWGGHTFLPQLLGERNPSDVPFAEYWMGIHPQGPAQLIDGQGHCQSLSEKDPSLSFLLKLLDVKDMLSIQVHPSKEMAAVDFEKENQAGIPLNAPNRNYKDANHKPELMIALSEFWLLHGFRPPESLCDVFEKHSFLKPLEEQWTGKGYAGLYRWVMELPQETVDEILKRPLLEMTDRYSRGLLSKSDPCFWAARAYLHFCEEQIDRGIFSIFLFNLVCLQPGEGIYQGAGVPHAYLEGQNVEIMANSDNVLRGGLTPKHIDVTELLRHVKTEPVQPVILNPEPDGDGCRMYPAPVSDFSIRSIRLSPGHTRSMQLAKGSVLLLPQGRASLSGDDLFIELGSPFLSAYVSTDTTVTVDAREFGQLFIATGKKE
jgi:mannose-6-phosphate isomerase